MLLAKGLDSEFVRRREKEKQSVIEVTIRSRTSTRESGRMTRLTDLRRSHLQMVISTRESRRNEKNGHGTITYASGKVHKGERKNDKQNS